MRSQNKSKPSTKAQSAMQAPSLIWNDLSSLSFFVLIFIEECWIGDRLIQ